MRYALGIDGGGSKCEVVLAAEDGTVVGRGLGGPTYTYYDPPEVVAASYREAVGAALRGITDAQLFVAGAVPPPEALAEAVGAAGMVIGRLFAREQETAYAAAGVTWGVVLLSGTGSFVHGRTEDGRELHFGGIGPVLGDYGSAHAIANAGLRAAFASSWSAARRTSLAEAIPQALEVPDLPGVFRLIYIEHINRRRLASLARVVDAEAQRGDPVARRCLLAAADEFADSAADLIRALELRFAAFPLIPIGGVARGSRLWWARVLERITDVAPQAYPLIPRIPPAAGAALLALREMGIPWTPELLERVPGKMGTAT